MLLPKTSLMVSFTESLRRSRICSIRLLLIVLVSPSPSILLLSDCRKGLVKWVSKIMSKPYSLVTNANFSLKLEKFSKELKSSIESKDSCFSLRVFSISSGRVS